MPGIDDRAGRAACEERTHVLDRLHRRAETDPLELAAGETIEALERQGEMRATLVTRDGVDLVDDHRARIAQEVPRTFRGEQYVERFRRRDQDVRRMFQHRR